jgi:arylsulfatase A-like enzyme
MSYCAAEADLISSVVNGKHHLTPEEKDFVVSLYDGEIRYLDDCLSLLFERLKALKVYDNTLIIITSDHGEAFGEHNLMAHSKTLYEELLRVPLVMKYPSGSLQQRGVIERRVSLVDVMPTIVSFLGYSIPPIIDGEPLTAVERPIIAEWHAK